MASIRERYGEWFKQIKQQNLSHAAAKIDATNVYQKANPATKKMMDQLVKENMAEGSRLEGIENFKAFLQHLRLVKADLF